MAAAIATVLILSWGALATQAESIPARATVISDGDTLDVAISEADFAALLAAHPTLRGSALKLRVRLRHCDAPEKAQPFGPEAKEALKALVWEKSLKLSDVTVDQYGRAVSAVKVGRSSVNRSMLLQGWAWWYYQYSDDVGMARVEASARAARRGIWSEIPEAPWAYRTRIREGASP